MSFRQKLKDKKYRAKVIIIAVLIIFVANMGGDEKKELQDQTLCNLANEDFRDIFDNPMCNLPQHIQNYMGGNLCMDQSILPPFGPTDATTVTCLGQSCEIGRYARDWDVDRYACLNCVPNGLRVQSRQQCCEDATPLEYENGYDFLCKAGEGESKCNSGEQIVADILLGIYPDFPGGCKTAYYAVLFGGGMMGFMMIGMIL